MHVREIVIYLLDGCSFHSFEIDFEFATTTFSPIFNDDFKVVNYFQNIYLCILQLLINTWPNKIYLWNH